MQFLEIVLTFGLLQEKNLYIFLKKIRRYLTEILANNMRYCYAVFVKSQMLHNE